MLLLLLASSQLFFVDAFRLHVIGSLLELLANEGGSVVEELLRAAALAKDGELRNLAFSSST